MRSHARMHTLTHTLKNIETHMTTPATRPHVWTINTSKVVCQIRLNNDWTGFFLLIFVVDVVAVAKIPKSDLNSDLSGELRGAVN